jgi:hypothetical protein
MKWGTLSKWLVCSALLLLSTFTPIYSQAPAAVSFLGIQDAVPRKYYNPVTTRPDPTNPNRLLIGFHTGIDPATQIQTAFAASTEAFYRSIAMDTLSFRVVAPAGFYVDKLTYTQAGSRTVARGGGAAGAGNWVVNGVGADLGIFGPTPTLTQTFDLSGTHQISLTVVIANSLFAHGNSIASGTITLDRAAVLVDLLPLSPTGGSDPGGDPAGEQTIPVTATPQQESPTALSNKVFMPLLRH